MKALARGMIHPEYVWMSYGWYSEGWWMDTDDVNCSEAQMRTAVERSLSFHHFPLPTQNEADAPTDVYYVSKLSCGIYIQCMVNFYMNNTYVRR